MSLSPLQSRIVAIGHISSKELLSRQWKQRKWALNSFRMRFPWIVDTSLTIELEKVIRSPNLQCLITWFHMQKKITPHKLSILFSVFKVLMCLYCKNQPISCYLNSFFSGMVGDCLERFWTVSDPTRHGLGLEVVTWEGLRNTDSVGNPFHPREIWSFRVVNGGFTVVWRHAVELQNENNWEQQGDQWQMSYTGVCAPSDVSNRLHQYWDIDSC